MKLCEFLRPASLPAARDNLRELGPKGMALAGGTALHFMQDHTPVTAVDITHLGLSYIRPDGDFYRIGATTPLADIQRYRAPRWAMHEICRRIATHQIRNISTLGGNVCRVFPWADLPVVLLAMNARMVVYTGHDQELGADAEGVLAVVVRVFPDVTDTAGGVEGEAVGRDETDLAQGEDVCGAHEIVVLDVVVALQFDAQQAREHGVQEGLDGGVVDHGVSRQVGLVRMYA